MADNEAMAKRFPPMGFRADGTSMITEPGVKPESVMPTVVPDVPDGDADGEEDEDTINALAEQYRELMGGDEDESE